MAACTNHDASACTRVRVPTEYPAVQQDCWSLSHNLKHVDAKGVCMQGAQALVSCVCLEPFATSLRLTYADSFIYLCLSVTPCCDDDCAVLSVQSHDLEV